MQNFLLSTPVSSIIFLFTIITSLYAMYGNQGVYRNLMLHPYSFTRGKNQFTIITSGFIHADMNHLLFNMFSYFFFAFSLERIVGHWQFAVIYLGGLIFSDVSTIIKNRNNIQYYSLGASGAISAILFSYILFDPLTKIYFLFIPIGIPAYLFALLYLGYCVYASRNQYDNVNHDAHFWGAVTGLLITGILFPGVIQYFIQRVF